MDRISGIRGKHHVSGTNCNKDKMRDSFLNTYGDDGFIIRIYIHVKSTFIPVCDGHSQLCYTHRRRISMILMFLGCFCEFINNMLRCSNVRISHSKVNNILPGMSGIHLYLVNDCKNIRWQPIKSCKLFHNS